MKVQNFKFSVQLSTGAVVKFNSEEDVMDTYDALHNLLRMIVSEHIEEIFRSEHKRNYYRVLEIINNEILYIIENQFGKIFIDPKNALNWIMLTLAFGNYVDYTTGAAAIINSNIQR